MITLLVLQLFVGMVAWFMGTHDAPACDAFYDKLPDRIAQKLFHGTNVGSKMMLWAIAMLACTGKYDWYTCMLQGLCYIAIMWPVFNIAVNVHRKNPKRSWDYISSDSNNTDSWLTDHLGTNAGKILVWICAASTLICDIVMIIYEPGGDIVWLG